MGKWEHKQRKVYPWKYFQLLIGKQDEHRGEGQASLQESQSGDTRVVVGILFCVALGFCFKDQKENRVTFLIWIVLPANTNSYDMSWCASQRI